MSDFLASTYRYIYRSLVMKTKFENFGEQCPCGKHQLVKRKRFSDVLLVGVGINDLPYFSQVDGARCRFYQMWKDMLIRCYSEKWQAKKPTYLGCTVAKEWHSASAFVEWCAVNWSEGYQIDKDLLIAGNKHYSPDTCTFLPLQLNTLLELSGKTRGLLPLGVSKHQRKYTAQIRIDGATKYLGTFSCPFNAHATWQKAKAENIRVMADRYRDSIAESAYDALNCVADTIEEDLLEGRITLDFAENNCYPSQAWSAAL